MAHSELTLYGHRGSGSAAVEAALVLAGLPFREVVAASWDPASALDELQRVNPLLQIPTLVWPNGTVMSESAAILIELGLRHPDSGLLSREPAARARAIRGLVYIAANCYATIGIVDFPDRVLDAPDPADAARVVARSKARLHELWDRFADQFEATPFLCGAAPGALDLLAAVVSRWAGTRAHLRAARPDWFPVLERIERHAPLAPLAPIFARHWPAA